MVEEEKENLNVLTRLTLNKALNRYIKPTVNPIKVHNCVCVCVCVCEREREREGGREREREDTVFVCVCVCERERERTQNFITQGFRF